MAATETFVRYTARKNAAVPNTGDTKGKSMNMSAPAVKMTHCAKPTTARTVNFARTYPVTSSPPNTSRERISRSLTISR